MCTLTTMHTLTTDLHTYRVDWCNFWLENTLILWSRGPVIHGTRSEHIHTLQFSLGLDRLSQTYVIPHVLSLRACQNYLAHRQKVHTAAHDVLSNSTVTHPRLQYIPIAPWPRHAIYTPCERVHIVSLENKMVNYHYSIHGACVQL